MFNTLASAESKLECNRSLDESKDYKEKDRHARYQSFLLYFSGHGYRPWPNWNALLQDLGSHTKALNNLHTLTQNLCLKWNPHGIYIPITDNHARRIRYYGRRIIYRPEIPSKDIEGSKHTSKDGISFEVHKDPSKDIFRSHRRIHNILRWHPSKHIIFQTLSVDVWPSQTRRMVDLVKHIVKQLKQIQQKT